MNVHKNAPLTPKGREAMVRSVVEGGLSKADTAYQFNRHRRPLPNRRRVRLTVAGETLNSVAIYLPVWRLRRAVLMAAGVEGLRDRQMGQAVPRAAMSARTQAKSFTSKNSGVSSEGRSVAIIAAIPVDFSAHRRRRAARQPSHRSCQSMYRNASRFLLAFRERQCQPRTMSRRGTNAPMRCHLKINRR